jgi:hypothetical protein
MGLNPATNSCANTKECSVIAQMIYDEECPESIADSLSDRNPYLLCNYFEENIFWSVITGREDLPPGYAVAENARLPCVVADGMIEVVVSDRGYARAVYNPSFFLEIDHSPIVLIEWCNEEIRQIYTQDQMYWWCSQRKDGSLLCSSDGRDAIEGDYWLTDYKHSCQLSFYGKPNRVELTSERLTALKPWLENVVTCEDQHYCVICQDSVRESNYGSCECNHIHYSDWLSSWGGCGYAEEDWIEDYRIALEKVDLSVLQQIKKYLEAKDISNLWELGWTLNDELEPAGVWLKSLDEDTPEAIAQTLSWLS